MREGEVCDICLCEECEEDDLLLMCEGNRLVFPVSKDVNIRAKVRVCSLDNFSSKYHLVLTHCNEEERLGITTYLLHRLHQVAHIHKTSEHSVGVHVIYLCMR
jgi:hypothetical protein